MATTIMSSNMDPSPRKGFRITKEKAKVCLGEFKKLEDTNGKLTPDIVLEAAKSRNSPLHEYFEWNNTKAAKEYRLVQARYLIRSIEVTIVPGKPKQRSYVADIEEEEAEESTKGYVSIETVLSDSDLRSRYIQRALNEAISWAQRYADIAELRAIVNSIRRTMVKYTPKKKASGKKRAATKKKRIAAKQVKKGKTKK